MTKPGPKFGNRKKPTALRIFEGNPGNLPLNPLEPAPEPLKTIDPPDWLSEDAKGVWSLLAPVLHHIGVLTEADQGPFTRYCDTYARWFKTKEVLDKEGETYESTNNYGETLYKLRPEFNVFMRLAKELRHMELEFGLTPASRSKIIAVLPNRLPEFGKGQGAIPVKGSSKRPASVHNTAPNPFDYAAQRKAGSKDA